MPNGELFPPETPDPSEALEEAGKRIAALLYNVGELGKCRGCNAEIYWVLHNSARLTPYDRDATNHFITCPKAERFRKGVAK